MSRREHPADTPEAPTIIRGACILLMVVGAATVMFSLPVILNPASARCQLGRAIIKEANEDKKDWNNVDTAGKKAKDVPCPDAVRLAQQIPRNEKGADKITFPSESALSTQNTVVVVLGVGQAASGFYLIRSLSRWSRNAALAFSGVCLILRVLSILSFGVFVFAAYALLLSPASREIWPREAPRG